MSLRRLFDSHIETPVPSALGRPALWSVLLLGASFLATWSSVASTVLLPVLARCREHEGAREDPGLRDGLAMRIARCTWKTEWNSVVNGTFFFEIRVGEFAANRRQAPHGDLSRFEDVGNLIVAGGNHDWQQNLRRSQMRGSLSYFKDGWLGNQHFKVGGEIFRTMATEIWQRAYPGDVLHVLQNRTPDRSVRIRDAFEIREWIVDIFCLRQRLLAGEQSLDAESGSPIRPLSPVSPRADTPAWLVQQDLAAVRAHICDAEQLRKCSGPGRARSAHAAWTTARFSTCAWKKGFPLGGHRRLAGFVDVFNLLNANPEQNTSWSSGSSFLRPLSIAAPLVARVGAKLEW